MRGADNFGLGEGVWASFARSALVMSLAAGMLGGCSSFAGAPEPIDPTAVVADQCPTKADIDKFDNTAKQLPGLSSRAQWRDEIVGQCIAEVDGRFRDFVTKLSEQSVGVNFGTDLVSLALTGTASVASKTTANVLAAAATGVTGAGKAFDKDMLYTQTLPAIVLQMHANRTAVYTKIRQAEQSNDETKYTLYDAQRDIRDYEFAGTINSAIADLTKGAQQNSDSANAGQNAIFNVGVRDATVLARGVAVEKYIQAITDKPTLDKFAAALGLTIASGATVSQERGAIKDYVDQATTTQDGMNAIAAKLDPLTTPAQSF